MLGQSTKISHEKNERITCKGNEIRLLDFEHFFEKSSRVEIRAIPELRLQHVSAPSYHSVAIMHISHLIPPQIIIQNQINILKKRERERKYQALVVRTVEYEEWRDDGPGGFWRYRRSGTGGEDLGFSWLERCRCPVVICAERGCEEGAGLDIWGPSRGKSASIFQFLKIPSASFLFGIRESAVSM